MTPSRRSTRPSPAQIRRQAATAFRNRVRAGFPDRALVLRQPEPAETPLSDAEVAWGMQSGLIRALRDMREIARCAGMREVRP